MWHWNNICCILLTSFPWFGLFFSSAVCETSWRLSMAEFYLLYRFCFWLLLIADLPVSVVNQFTSLRLNYLIFSLFFSSVDIWTFQSRLHPYSFFSSCIHVSHIYLAGKEGWMICEEWITYRVLKYLLILLFWAWTWPCHMLFMWPWANQLSSKPWF